MIFFVTAVTWLTIGFLLDAFDVFEDDDDAKADDSAAKEDPITAADILDADLHGDIINGTSRDDLLLGDSDSDLMSGKGGDDHIYAAEGDDSVIGGNGDDFLRGGPGNDYLQGDLGNDIMWGGSGDDALAGVVFKSTDAGLIDVDGADQMIGGTGDDVLLMGNSDVCSGNDGADIFAGGTWIQPGQPATVQDFDDAEDAVVFAYDPNQTPNAVFTLEDGTETGEKVLAMNGQPMVKIANAAGMTLADVNFLEMSLAA